MPTADMIRMEFRFTLPNGTPAAVVRHIDLEGENEVTELDAIAQAVEDWWTTTVGPVTAAREVFSAGLTLDDLVFTQMFGGAPYQLVHEVNSAGTAAGDAPPNESAIVTTWRTGIPGRSFRGRSFWPGYELAMLGSDGQLATGEVTLLNSVFNRLIDDVNAAGDPSAVFAVYSKTLDVMTPITSVVTRAIPHHQTRRNA